MGRALDGSGREIEAGSFAIPPDASPGPPIPPAEARRLIRLADACPYRTKDPGCCTGYSAWCYRATAGKVSQFDCIECVKAT